MLEKKIINFIEEYNLIKINDTIIVGLSGGPDSVFLLHILKKIQKQKNLNLIAAHLDHQWRCNSADDVLFCKKICQELNILFITKKASDIKLLKKQCGTSKEEYGRLLRRQFFEDLVQEYKANSIALGHHWDDQKETFFVRLIRGAGIPGLACMKPKKNLYIRPLLNITKKEIIQYLNTDGIQYIKDYTNDLDIFLRNKIRKYLIPTIENIDSRFNKTFALTLKNIQAADNFINQFIENLYEKITISENKTILLNKKKFLELDEFIQISILVKWICYSNVPFIPSEKLFKELIRFIKHPHTQKVKHTVYTSWSILKSKNFLQIIKK